MQGRFNFAAHMLPKNVYNWADETKHLAEIWQVSFMLLNVFPFSSHFTEKATESLSGRNKDNKNKAAFEPV